MTCNEIRKVKMIAALIEAIDSDDEDDAKQAIKAIKSLLGAYLSRPADRYVIQAQTRCNMPK